MMIEISEKQYWKKLNWYDGHLYCSLLNIDGKDGWRMIRDDEQAYEILIELYGVDYDDPFDTDYQCPIWSVNLNYTSLYDNEICWVIPVRENNCAV